MDKATSIEQMPTEHVRCRTFGHAWEEFIPTNMRKQSFGFRYSLLCTSCGTQRHDLLDVNWHVAERRYIYPDLYQASFKAGRDEYRAALSERKRKRVRRGSLIKELG